MTLTSDVYKDHRETTKIVTSTKQERDDAFAARDAVISEKDATVRVGVREAVKLERKYNS